MPSNNIPTNGLIDRWPLNETSGTTAVNIIDTDYNGALHGGTSWTTGLFGNGLAFDGNDGRVSVPSIDLTDKSFSLAAWVKGDTSKANNTIISQGNDTTSERLNFGYDETHFFFSFFNDDLYVPIVPDENWNLWVATYDATTKEQRIYRNGVLFGSRIANAHYQGSGDVYFGRLVDEPLNKNLKGILDEVLIYNRVLTPLEAAQMFQTAPEGAKDLGKPVAVVQDCASSSCASGCGLPVWSVTPLNQNLLVQDAPFFYRPGRGPAIEIRLSYNVAGDSDMATLFGADKLPFGEGWIHNFGTFIEQGDAVSGQAIVRMPDMRTDTYVVGSDETTYLPLFGLGLYGTLTKPDADTFLLRFKDGTVFKYEYLGFDLTNGDKCFQLTQITDPLGNVVTLEYDGTDKWKLLTITDALDQDTDLTWTASEGQNRVSAVVNEDLELSAEFGYDEEHRLNSITDQAQFTSTFEYADEEVTPPIMTTVTTPKTYPRPTAQFSYEIEEEEITRKISSVRLADESVWQYLAEDDTRIIVDPLNRRTTHVLNEFGGSAQIIDARGKVLYQVYDENRLLTRVIDRDLRVTDFVYDTPIGSAIQFDGTDGYMSAAAIGLGATDAVSISVWVKIPANSAASQSIVQLGATGLHVGVFSGDSRLTFHLPGTAQVYSAPTNIADGNLHHVVVAKTSGGITTGNVKIYLDNEELSLTLAGSGNADYTGDLQVAKRSSSFLECDVMELGIWEKQLSANEVESLWNDGIGRIINPAAETDLIRLYHFNEGEGDTVADASESEEDGTLHDGFTWIDAFMGASLPNRGNLTTEKRYKELYPGDPADIGTNEDMSAVAAVVRNWHYNGNDLVLLAQDPKGSVWYEYGDENFPFNPTKITDRLGHDTLIAYVAPASDGEGKPSMITDRNGKEWDFGYNAAGDLTSQKDPLDNETTHAYDERSRRISTTNALTQTTEFEWDDLNRNIETTFPDTKTIQRIFNCCEELEVIDQAENSWRKIYDPMVAGRVRMEIDPMGRVIVYNYSFAGELVSLTDPKGATWWFVRDELGRVVMQIDPLFRARKFTYDNEGNVTSRTDEKGDVTTYTRDALGRLTRVVYPDTTEINYTYDDVGNRLTMEDTTGLWTWLYDAESRMISAQTPQAENPSLYEYDNEGNRTKLTDPDGNTMNYVFDNAYRLLSLTASADPDPLVWSFTPDVLGRVEEREMPNGIKSFYQYDVMSRIETITHEDSEENLLLSFAYERDDLGNVLKVTRGVGGDVTMPTEFGDGSWTDYGYDLTSQLLSEQYHKPNTDLFREHGYEYDLAGNRLRKTSVVDSEEEENTSYDVANQILKRIRTGAFGSETTVFEQDANGNLTKETIGSSPQVVKTLGYNFENNMVSFRRVVQGDSDENTVLRYSGDGLRVEKTDPAQELSKFTLDGVAVALHKASTVAEDLKSFAFDGSTDINYGACPDFSSTGGLSVSAWVKDWNEAAGYFNGILKLGGTNLCSDSNYGGLIVDIEGVVSYLANQLVGTDKHHIYLRYDGSGSFSDPHMELYLDGEKLTLTPNVAEGPPNFTGDLIAGIGQSEYEGKLDQLAIWDTDKGAGDFLSELYNEGEGRIIESNEEDLVLLSLFNENYDDSTGTFPSPTLTGNETYDDPLVTDARGPLEPKMRFIPGLAMIDAEGDVSYYLEDALGSVMALADDEEEVTGVYQYNAWGIPLVEPENDVNPYRWCGTWGYYWDANAEMYLLGLRWYDPRAGRFITQDPIGFGGGDGNLYRYVVNRSPNAADPEGKCGPLCWILIGLGAGAVIGGGIWWASKKAGGNFRNLTATEQQQVGAALQVLGSRDSFSIRVGDLNKNVLAQVVQGNNSVITLSPNFFSQVPIMQQAILLHEMSHASAKFDETEAYTLMNCFLLQKFRGSWCWYGDAKYKPATWPTICNDPKYSNWSQYVF